MRVLQCAYCGSRNRVRDYGSNEVPVCGKCGFPLQARGRALRIIESVRGKLRPRDKMHARNARIALATITLFVCGGFALWYLAADNMAIHNAPSLPPIATRDRAASGTEPVVLPERQPPTHVAAIKPIIALAVVPVKQGVQKVFVKRKRLAPLGIETPVGAENYYITLVDAVRRRRVMTMYVRGGQRFETTVPLGSYEVIYAVGRTWYGSRHKFGDETTQYRLTREGAGAGEDGYFSFTRENGGYAGVTIELTKRLDGNLQSQPIPTSEFSYDDDEGTSDSDF